MNELNLVLLGPPGAGKGTQAARLEDDFHLPYIATGELLRAAVKEATELGVAAKEHMAAGRLVPDELVIGMILERVDGGGATEGFLLDGFPRNREQAQALGAALARLGRTLSGALLIEVPEDVVVERISGRRVCAANGHVFHVRDNPPAVEGVCDEDGSPLEQREDDREDVVRERISVYEEHTAPIADFYEQQGLLHRFDGTRSPVEVHDHLRATIATLRREDEV